MNTACSLRKVSHVTLLSLSCLRTVAICYQHRQNHTTRCRDSGAGDSWRALLAPFVGVTAPCRSTDSKHDDCPPCEWPRVRHTEATGSDANGFGAVREIVHDRLQYTKTRAARISAITQVDIYDSNSGALSSLAWIELVRLLVEARGYSR